MKIKKIISILTIVTILMGMLSVSVLANDKISIVLDGEQLIFDVQPQIINGRTMVPMRKIFEAMGASVEWEGTAQKITAIKGDITIIMQIDNESIIVNDKNITLDVPPQLVDGRTLVPARAVAESLKAKVEWDGETSTVIINSQKNAYEVLYDQIKTSKKTISFFDENNGCMYNLLYDSENDRIYALNEYSGNDNYYTYIELDTLTYVFSFGDLVLQGYLPKNNITNAAALLYNGIKGEFEELDDKYAFLDMAKKEVFKLIRWLDIAFNENNLNISTEDIGIPSINNKVSANDAHEILKQWIKDNGKIMGNVVSFNIYEEPNENGEYDIKGFSYDANEDYVYITDSSCEKGEIIFFTMIKLLQEQGKYKYGFSYHGDPTIVSKVLGEIEPADYRENTPITYVTCNVSGELRIPFLEVSRNSICYLIYYFDDYLTQCVGSISAEDFGFALLHD